MKKIILDLAVTSDGFIEGPNRETDWCILDDDIYSSCCIWKRQTFI